jgi:hypothetical protein
MPASYSDTAPQGQLKTVCRVCGRGPADGVPLFSHMVGGERRRFCPEHLPLAQVRQRLEAQRGPSLDADVVAVFTRRLEAG